MKPDETPTGNIDRALAAFGSRLDSILGRRRIPRSEKRATAEAATKAVDDLLGAIDDEISGIDKPV